MSVEGKPPVPLEEWQAEVIRLGKFDCKFRCPICGNEASINDWKALVPDAEPDRALTECIGRTMPRDQRRNAFAQNAPDAPEQPCDYAAFGLFNLCTASVERPNGKITPVFEFAEVSA